MTAWNELSGSPKFEVQADGAAAERRGLVAWTDLDAFVAELFPPTPPGSGPNGQQPGAPFPDRPHLRVASIQMQPFGERIIGPNTSPDFESAAAYDQAVVTVRYATPKASQSDEESEDDSDPVPFLRHRWTIGGEFLSLPPAGVEWTHRTDPVPEDLNAGLFVPTIEHEVTVPRVLEPPFATIRDRIGTVNAAPLTLSTGVISPETLLFLGAALDRVVMSDGRRAWELTYRFSERRVYPQDQDVGVDGFGGWNHFWLAGEDDGGWFRLQRKGTSGELDLFRRASFLELFQTGAP